MLYAAVASSPASLASIIAHKTKSLHGWRPRAVFGACPHTGCMTARRRHEYRSICASSLRLSGRAHLDGSRTTARPQDGLAQPAALSACLVSSATPW